MERRFDVHRLAEEVEVPNISFMNASEFGGLPRNFCTRTPVSSTFIPTAKGKGLDRTNLQRLRLLPAPSRLQNTLPILRAQLRIQRILFEHRGVHVRREDERIRVATQQQSAVSLLARSRKSVGDCGRKGEKLTHSNPHRIRRRYVQSCPVRDQACRLSRAKSAHGGCSTAPYSPPTL